MPIIETVLVKVASRCNLDCSYCYVYRMGDGGWRLQPKRMSGEAFARLGESLRDLVAAQGRPLSVVLHGGEPLLLGASRLEDACRVLRHFLPTCEIGLQTNGILLSHEIVATCVRYDVSVSVSIDGPASAHDRHRKDHRGRSSHAAVSAGITNLTATAAGVALFSGVLAVIDLLSDPIEVYEALKATGAPSMDLLYRDGNHDTLPVGKASFLSTEYGDWMCGLLDHYLADRDPTPVRVLDDMLKLILGGRASKEGVGLDGFGILVIETDGTISKNDTLKVAHDGADRFDEPVSIFDCNLADLVRSRPYANYRAAQSPTSRTCLECADLGICGGGMPAHRWKDTEGFDNPSIFCNDQRRLIDHMRSHLRRRMLAA